MSTTKPILRMASRGSPLALVQARAVRQHLANTHGWGSDLDAICPILVIKTTGDKIQDRPLADAGGKGLFVKEIEEALLAREADIAVHSAKDLPSVLPKGLAVVCVPKRETTEDILITRGKTSLRDLAPGSTLGTSSVRRQAQMLRQRPDLKLAPLRGNVETRLAKLARGEADATILAKAGLARLGLRIEGETLAGEHFLPALCQGALGIEICEENARARDLLTPLHDAPTGLAVACERGFLAALDGSCRTPIAGLARMEGSQFAFTGEVLTPDGRNFWTASRAIKAAGLDEAGARALGEAAAAEIKAKAGDLLPTF